MTPASAERQPRRPRTAWIVAAGATVVGALDLADACIFYGLRSGTTPLRILQSIAAGLLGRASFSGGAQTAALGLGLHFFIASAIVVTCVIISRSWRQLAERPFVYGPLYGVGVYIVMNFVVVPHSAAGSGSIPWPVVVNAAVVNSLLIHMFGVGLPSALTARGVARRQPASLARAGRSNP